MNRTLPPGDRGDRKGTDRGQSRRGRLVPGAGGLVGRVTDSPDRADGIGEMNEARTQLGVSLRTILERDRGNELNRLLLEMCEADQLERCVHDEIRSWQPTSDNDFASRWYAIEDETRAAIAKLFFDGLLVFSVEAGTPLDVRWVCRVAEGVS